MFRLCSGSKFKRWKRKTFMFPQKHVLNPKKHYCLHSSAKLFPPPSNSGTRCGLLCAPYSEKEGNASGSTRTRVWLCWAQGRVSPQEADTHTQPSPGCPERSPFTHCQLSVNVFEVLCICRSLNGKLYFYCKLNFNSVLPSSLAHLKYHDVMGIAAFGFFFRHLIPSPLPYLKSPM